MANKKITTTEYSYTIIYEPIAEGGYQVSVPLLPGVITYGRTFEEAKKMARDAVKCCVESLQKDREKVPTETSLLQERVTISLAS